MTDKRCVNNTKVTFEALSTPEKLDTWMEVALRKNALSCADKLIIEELVSFFKRNMKKSILEKNSWLEEALENASEGSAMYDITWHFNRMFNAGLFKEVDQILDEFIVETASVGILISILTCAAWAKDKLVHRVEFFNRVKTHLININKLEPGLLEGLE
jgi:hypothetical protein